MARPRTQESVDASQVALRRAERWIIPASLLGLVGVLGVAWYGAHVLAPRVVHDATLTASEAAYWVNSKRLIGLSAAQAQPLVDAPIVPSSDDAALGMVAITEHPSARHAPRRLQLRFVEGRIQDAALVPAN